MIRYLMTRHLKHRIITRKIDTHFFFIFAPM